MNTFEVRIVRLEPLRVASAYGFGPEPESLAWDKLKAWIKETGLDQQIAGHHFLGFNNPSPSIGSPNYGYEQWVTVDPATPASPGASQQEGIVVKDFPGGLYAVRHCKLGVITEAWKELVAWREHSRYRQSRHQWLEECLTSPFDHEVGPDSDFDLFLPIAE